MADRQKETKESWRGRVYFSEPKNKKKQNREKSPSSSIPIFIFQNPRSKNLSFYLSLIEPIKPNNIKTSQLTKPQQIGPHDIEPVNVVIWDILLLSLLSDLI